MNRTVKRNRQKYNTHTTNSYTTASERTERTGMLEGVCLHLATVCLKTKLARKCLFGTRK